MPGTPPPGPALAPPVRMRYQRWHRDREGDETHGTPHQGRRRADGPEQRGDEPGGDRRAHARPAGPGHPGPGRADRLSRDGADDLFPEEDPHGLRPVLRERGAPQGARAPAAARRPGPRGGARGLLREGRRQVLQYRAPHRPRRPALRDVPEDPPAGDESGRRLRPGVRAVLLRPRRHRLPRVRRRGRRRSGSRSARTGAIRRAIARWRSRAPRSSSSATTRRSPPWRST